MTSSPDVSEVLTCWAVTGGARGMEVPTVGLAEALGLKPVVKRVRLKLLWHRLFPFFRGGLAHAFDEEAGDPLRPPWPDVLVATGRVGAAASLAVRRASQREGTPHRDRTFTLQIQDPHLAPCFFDLMVVPQHDTVRGPNVITTRGSLHGLTSDILAREAVNLRSRLEENRSPPRIAVLIGGPNKVYAFSPAVIRNLVARLQGLMARTGGSLLVVPSRRTPPDLVVALREGLADSPAWIWDGTDPNPYIGVLGLADAVVVTADSVNMVTEACFTGRPVYVVALSGGSAKFERFHAQMQKEGFTRPFTGEEDRTWTPPPRLDDRPLVVKRVREALGIVDDAKASDGS